MRVFVVLCFVFTIVLSSCNSNVQSISHTTILEDCMDNESLELLDEMVTNLETTLDKYYGSHHGAGYESYLKDMYQFDVPKPLMRDDEYMNLSLKYKMSGLYERFKIKESELFPDRELIEIPPTEGQETAPTLYEPMVVNPQSEYANCLESSASPEVLKEILHNVHRGVEISPSYMSMLALDNFQPDDYNKQAVKLFITTYLYFEVGLLMLDILTEGNTSL